MPFWVLILLVFAGAAIAWFKSAAPEIRQLLVFNAYASGYRQLYFQSSDDEEGRRAKAGLEILQQNLDEKRFSWPLRFMKKKISRRIEIYLQV